MIKTFEQFDWDDPFGEDAPQKSYIGYDGTLKEYIREIDCKKCIYLFGFLDQEKMTKYRRILIQDILKALRSCGVDDEDIIKIEYELRDTYPII